MVPWAEDAVVRAAYLALMRVYHPDRNKDPEAELRVREITGAFAVLGDSAKRAAYDALPSVGHDRGTAQEWFGADRSSHLSIRNLLIASLALALTLSLAVAAWTGSPSPKRSRTALANSARAQVRVAESGATHVSTPGHLPAAQKGVLAPVHNPHVVSLGTNTPPITPLGQAGDAFTKQSNRQNPPVPTRQIPQAVVSKTRAPTPTPIAADRPAGTAIESTAITSCRAGSSTVDEGECTDDRQAQIERIATGFLKQSIEHSDWHKQQLLLSARNRFATTRTLCRSNDCVTDAYLRQIRDVTEIMQGGTPTP